MSFQKNSRLTELTEIFTCFFRRAGFMAFHDANLLSEHCSGVAGSRGEGDQVSALRHGY